MSHERIRDQETDGLEKRPHIFKFSFSGKVPERDFGFRLWLEHCVYPQKSDTTSCWYGRSTNPLVVNPKEVILIQNNLEFYGFPFVAINGEIKGEELAQTQRVLERATNEYFTSFSQDYRHVLQEIEHPETDEEFQLFLLKCVGVYDHVRPESAEGQLLTDYVAAFCTDPKSVKILAINLLKSRIQEESLRRSLPSDD